MIGLEQREQTMPESRHWYLYERLGDRDVQGAVCASLVTHLMVTPGVGQ